MADREGDMQVSFVASRKTHSIQAIIELCQTVSLAIVQLISTLTNELYRAFLYVFQNSVLKIKTERCFYF